MRALCVLLAALLVAGAAASGALAAAARLLPLGAAEFAGNNMC